MQTLFCLQRPRIQKTISEENLSKLYKSQNGITTFLFDYLSSFRNKDIKIRFPELSPED